MSEDGSNPPTMIPVVLRDLLDEIQHVDFASVCPDTNPRKIAFFQRLKLRNKFGPKLGEFCDRLVAGALLVAAFAGPRAR
jgi:hypothetical protein